MPGFHSVAKFILKILFLLLTRRKIRGKENIPNQGPLLVVANHLSMFDPPLMSVSFSRKVIFMAKEGVFGFRFFNPFIRSFGAFPVRKGQPDRKALRQANQVLAEGLPLVVFPEGTRSHDAQLEPALLGPALIALRNNVPILPIGITGTEKIKGKAWLFYRPRLTVNIGQLFYLPQAKGELDKAMLTQVANLIMRHIAELLPAGYRGSYAGD